MTFTFDFLTAKSEPFIASYLSHNAPLLKFGLKVRLITYFTRYGVNVSGRTVTHNTDARTDKYTIPAARLRGAARERKSMTNFALVDNKERVTSCTLSNDALVLVVEILSQRHNISTSTDIQSTIHTHGC